MSETTVKDELRSRVWWSAELRERIATAALPALYTRYAEEAAKGGGYPEWQAAIAKDACDMADALVNELVDRYDAGYVEADS